MAPPNPKDPRFRPYRAAVYGVYLSVVVGFCLLVIISVVRSVQRMTPERPSAPEVLLTPRECVDGVEGLFRELESARQSLERGEEDVQARGAALRWSEFRVSWLERFRALEARCAPEARSRRGLRPVFEDLERVLDLYTTHAVQYAGEVGPTVDRLRDSLQAVRREPGMGRLP